MTRRQVTRERVKQLWGGDNRCVVARVFHNNELVKIAAASGGVIK